MILKLSDLQRSLDYSLATTHGQYRVYVIIGHYCSKAGELYAALQPRSTANVSLASDRERL